MKGMNGCRELDRRSAACSGFGGLIGFESDGSMRCVAIVRPTPVPFMGHPAFPFIVQGKARVTVEGKEEKEKEKKSSRIAGSFFFLHVGPADPVDVNRDSSMSRPFPSIAPCAGVVSWLWRFTPS